jgi:L-aminopeptidase/D-esterase-like protein
MPTVTGPVPIVVGCVLYDLAVGDGSVRPRPADGYAACVAAVAGPHGTGRVGAGTGATVGKHHGPGLSRPGGIGTATCRGDDGLVVSALIACNAWGDLRERSAVPTDAAPFTSTTIGVIATNARLDKVQCLLAAQSGHDGMARALAPVHALVDGDALIAAATGDVEVPLPLGLEVVRALAADAVEQATTAAAGPYD